MRASRLLTLVAGIAAVLFLVSLFANPHLRTLGLPEVARLADITEIPGIIRGERAVANISYRRQHRGQTVKSVRTPAPAKHAPRPAAGQPLVFGFYVNWDRSSIVSLRLHAPHLTHLLPEWLTLANGRGDLIDESDPAVIQIAREANLPVLAVVTNFRDGWRAGELHAVLASKASRENLIDNIAANLAEHRFAGVNIDLESLGRQDRDRMVLFMEELRGRLKPEGYLLTQSAPTSDPAYDLKRLAAINDYLMPMVYDEHYQSGPPGPVASDDWFEKEISKLDAILPAEKTIIGIGNYGYDWTLGETGAAEVAFADLMAVLNRTKAPVEWDRENDNPFVQYKLEGKDHEVWFLDAITALNQVNTIRDAGFRGVGVWRLGAEDPGLWNVLPARRWPAEPFPVTELFRMPSLQLVNQYGSGEVVRVAETPRDGSRNVWRTADGDYEAKYAEAPSYYVLEAWGGAKDKKLAITFDDGPEPAYTGPILDVLEKERVPATFFVVGLNAEKSPELLRRMHREGHLIGNHSYSHPNIAAISAERARLELSTTLRIIEHAVGRSTILFRPPYNADSEPQTPDEIVPLLRAQELGYITIGERVDPRDWQPGITADQIVAEVQSEITDGHIILLHDGGGDRKETVAALPRMIRLLRAQGYEFVPVSDLIGKTRDEVMPAPSAEEQRWAAIEGEAFDAKSGIKRVIGMLFLLGIYLTLLRSAVFGVLAVAEKIRNRRRTFDPAFAPPVSVIIAAYNEEAVIARTVRSVLENGYPAIEVVVVDDGSADRTLAVLEENFGADPRVRILSQANQGKSTALNAAIARSSYGLLIALDADTIFRKGTIAALVKHFENPRVGAVSGNARVGNRARWITQFQAIEYIYGFNLDRRALDLLNAITVVPGAAGAWRRDLVLQAGGFQTETLAEDTDLTIAIRRLGFEIRYEEQAIAWTEAPETTAALLKQRFRWSYGTLQAAWKHRDALFHPKYGFLGFVALPSIWLFQVLLACLAPLAEISMFLALFAGNVQIVLLFYLGFFLVELATGFLAYALEGEKPWPLALLFFQRIYYRQLMLYVLGKSIVYALRGPVVGWGKLERRASVSES